MPLVWLAGRYETSQLQAELDRDLAMLGVKHCGELGPGHLLDRRAPWARPGAALQPEPPEGGPGPAAGGG